MTTGVSSSVTLNADGTLNFTPNRDFNGPTSFTYTVSSGGVTETATVRLDVTPVNDPPVPRDPGGVPRQTFDPDSGNYHIFTPQDQAVSGRVVGSDPEGDTLTYTLNTPPTKGTVVVNPDGTYTYTPSYHYVGEDSFVVFISDGNGGVVASTVFITVAPVGRDDFPQVFHPEDSAPAKQWDSRIEVEPTVIQAVNFARFLNGTTTLGEVSGVVLKATNGVDSLDGTPSLPAHGAVLAAVNGVDPLNGSASYDRLASSTVERTLLLAGRGDSTHLGFVSTLHAGNGLVLQATGDGQQVWVSVGGADNVREIRATLPNGQALPGWARMDSRGFLVIDRPAGVDQLRLKVTVVPERGATRSQVIELDFNSGQMRAVEGREMKQQQMRPMRAPGRPHADAPVPDFQAQLDAVASTGVDHDAELLELLG
ncbi:MAG: tandem-95 repeat protein [Proteobacteria bacterium]|nr:tandem-95 repeat protein [Pseudomonadota bacterium]